MASTFKNAKQAIGTSYATVYTVPAATTAIVIGCQVANVDGTNAANAYVQWLDDSDADAATRLLDGGQVPAKYAIEVLAHKLVLEAGDQLQAKASAASDLEITVSVLELT